MILRETETERQTQRQRDREQSIYLYCHVSSKICMHMEGGMVFRAFIICTHSQ